MRSAEALVRLLATVNLPPSRQREYPDRRRRGDAPVRARSASRIDPPVAFAAASVIAAGIAAAVRITTPFDHGIWLVAYLVLVGFAAQLLLVWGQVATLPSPPPRATRLRQTVLWNLGVVAVPLGVLVDARLPVVVGSICLLTALTDHWRASFSTHQGPGAGPPWLRYGYLALLGLLSASVFVGGALAWDQPWF